MEVLNACDITRSKFGWEDSEAARASLPPPLPISDSPKVCIYLLPALLFEFPACVLHAVGTAHLVLALIILHILLSVVI